MTEVYAFFAALTLQILAMSVLYPAWFTRYWRTQAASIPAERLAQLYPDVDIDRVLRRFSTRYRTLNTVIAVLGLVLLGWLARYMMRPGWDDGPVETLVSIYFFVQVLPLGLIVRAALKLNATLVDRLLERKRSASLERRGLFDFVSPFAVGLAVLCYLFFAAFVAFVVQQRQFAGFAGFGVNVGVVTLLYAINAFVVYVTLYGKKFHSFETHARRVHRIGLTVRSSVYSCIACVVFLTINFTLVLLGLQRWEPFALSVFFVICGAICLMCLAAPPDRAEAPAGAKA